MRNIKVYKPSELKKKHPEGFERAHEWYINHNTEIPWSDEIIDSLKAVFEASGIRLRDWSIDVYGYSYVKFDMGDAANLEGQRAMAWLENNLLEPLRERRSFIQRVKKYDRWNDFTKYGEIPSCPFTGVCFDEDYIESLFKSVKGGDSLEEAYSHLANVAARLFEAEIENQNSEEWFLGQDYLEFTKEGRVI